MLLLTSSWFYYILQVLFFFHLQSFLLCPQIWSGLCLKWPSDRTTPAGHYWSLSSSPPSFFSKSTNSAFTSCSWIHCLTPLIWFLPLPVCETTFWKVIRCFTSNKSNKCFSAHSPCILCRNFTCWNFLLPWPRWCYILLVFIFLENFPSTPPLTSCFFFLLLLHNEDILFSTFFTSSKSSSTHIVLTAVSFPFISKSLSWWSPNLAISNCC